MSAATPPNVYSYSDYRRFLADHYAYAKAEHSFSFRAFSQRAGIRSSNYLKLVIDGERNLSAAMAARFAKGCGLTGDRAEFFCELVAYCQATSAAERNRGYERLYRFRPFRAVHQLAKEQAAYHSQWYVPAIRELVRRPDFQDDPAWVALQLEPKISPAQAEKAIATLLKLGLLRRQPAKEGGRLEQTNELVTTGSGPLGHHIYSFHHMMLERAGYALDHSPRDERDISCLTLCVSDAKRRELEQRVRAFRKELLQAAEVDNCPERVVQVNFQVFALSAAVAGPGANQASDSSEDAIEDEVEESR
ncbi:MAG TPA: TIGR02147 family protein [Polyangiaceae bacterium]|nr:TIGR02147 family protein [Polyangiaceae bacterium]